MQDHFIRLGPDTSHFTGQGHLRGKTHSWTPRRPLNEILVQNSTYRDNKKLKRRLLKEGLLTNHCYICGLEPIWLGEPLVLVLDHINGDALDYRLENLRLLCPNCNSQQATFAGRNIRRRSDRGMVVAATACSHAVPECDGGQALPDAVRAESAAGS
jgi:hypothetical protein